MGRLRRTRYLNLYLLCDYIKNAKAVFFKMAISRSTFFVTKHILTVHMYLQVDVTASTVANVSILAAGVPILDVNVDIAKDLSNLCNVAANQQLVIKKTACTVSLDFILSFLGVTDTIDDLVSDRKADVFADRMQSKLSLTSTNAARRAQIKPCGARLYLVIIADALHYPARHSGSPSSQQYICRPDDKKRRETSVVISGLAPEETIPDSQAGH